MLNKSWIPWQVRITKINRKKWLVLDLQILSIFINVKKFFCFLHSKKDPNTLVKTQYNKLQPLQCTQAHLELLLYIPLFINLIT